MKVIKPFVRDGVRYNRGDAAPSGLDKQAVAHYLQLGLVEQGATIAGGPSVRPAMKTASAPAPAPQRRHALPGPQERKPASPNEPASASSAVGTAVGAQESIANTLPNPTVDAAATADPAAALLPLGPVDIEAAKA